MAIADINQGIVNKLTGLVSGTVLVNAIGWLIIGIIVIGIAGWGAWYYLERRKYNRKITAHGIIHGHFHPVYHDVGKTVKLGKGGFEILYLKKLKTWKLAHGARGGIKDYHFYIMPDGYWFPGQVSADLKQIDKEKGMISVVTTNPSMRAQYTSLEKQIDTLHGDKKGFWEQYGQWILTGAYVAIIGIFCWLSWREIAQFLGAGNALAQQMEKLAIEMNKLAVNLNGGASGLVPA